MRRSSTVDAFGVAASPARAATANVRRGTALISGAVFEWLALLASACIVGAVALDALGIRLRPLPVVLAALLIVAPPAALSLRARWRSRVDWPTDLVVLLVGAAIGWQLLVASGSALLPVGNSVDAVHHASLARFILEQGSLVHDPVAAAPALGEMADYPPGFAILAALLAGTGDLGAYAVVHALAAAAVVLAGCGIALLAGEGASSAARPLAAACGLLLLLVPSYSLGIVVVENYYAQALAQCLIVGCAYVAARDREAPLPLVAWKLGLLLLATVFVYTTWLPIALVAVGAGLLARNERRTARLLAGAALLGGAATAALVFGGARAATGSSVVLHEGSTIRDPLAATGVMLPLFAAVCLPFGLLRRARWAGLGLIGGTLVLLAGFGALWLRGAVAGYIFFKVFYLLAIVLPIPIGWAAAALVEAVAARRPLLARLGAGAGLMAALAGAALSALQGAVLASTAAAEAHPLSPALARAGDWMLRNGASDAMYILRQPGLPAYWMHVGLLAHTRDASAERLLHEAPPSLAEWYYDPAAPRFVLIEQHTPPAALAGTALRYGDGGVWVLEKTPQYGAAMERARPLLVSYRAAAQGDTLGLRLRVADAAGDGALDAQLAAMAGGSALASKTVQLPAEGDAQLELAVQQAGDYEIVLRLVRGEQAVAERKLADCGDGGCAVIDPGGALVYAQPEPAAAAPAALELGLGESIDLGGASVDSRSLRAGESLQLGLRWLVRQPPNSRYVTFVQLIAADGGAAASVEGEPGGGQAPTWRWRAGDTIDDSWSIPVGADVRPGSYQLVVGMYDAASGERLPAWRRAPFLERFWSGALPLGEITID